MTERCCKHEQLQRVVWHFHVSSGVITFMHVRGFFFFSNCNKHAHSLTHTLIWVRQGGTHRAQTAA